MGIACLSLVLAVVTLGEMLALTALTLVGVDRLRPQRLARINQSMVGAALCVLGIVTVVAHH